MAGIVLGGIQIPMQNYKSLHVSVMIWATLVHKLIHRKAHSCNWLYMISSGS